MKKIAVKICFLFMIIILLYGCQKTPVVQDLLNVSKWNSISAGFDHTVGIKSDGTLWAWGYNGRGQLGDGTRVGKTTPEQIGNDKWVSTSAGGDGNTLGIKNDMTLWAWGDNYFGQLGDGTKTNKLLPTNIP